MTIGEIFSLILVFGLGLVSGFFVTFLKEKAKNLAIQQDIGKITEAIEDVKHQNNLLLEEVKGHHQLRMAALDRRLETHQEAYKLWVSLLSNLKSENFADVLKECREWWIKNCLYLSPEPRNAFIKSVNIAHMLEQYERYPSENSKLIKESYLLLNSVGETIEKAAELPSIGQEEFDFIKKA